MHCQTCGAKNKQTARYCRGCGRAVQPAMQVLNGSGPVVPGAPGAIVVSSAAAPSIILSAPMMVPTAVPQAQVKPLAVAPQPQQQQQQPASTTKTSCCPSCGVRRRETDWFCGLCGHRLPPSQAPLCLKCGCALCTTQRFCHSCGTEIAELKQSVG